MKEGLLDLAQRQFGVLGRDQILSAGLNRHAIEHRLQAGEWMMPLPGVYRVRAAPLTLQQEAMAALLWAGDGAALSHSTAGSLWGFESMLPRPIHVICERASRAPEGVVLHRMKHLEEDIVSRRGLTLTSVPRTLIDLAAAVPVPTLTKALDFALNRRLTTFDRLAERLALQSGPGRRGAKALRGILSDGPRRTQSELERKFLRHYERSGLPPIEKQFPIDFTAFEGHVDFAIPSVKIAIECQGYSYHGGKRAWAKDGFRRNQLTVLGWRVLYVTWADIEKLPDEVIAQLRQMIQSL